MQLLFRPMRLHDSVSRVRVRTEQQVPEFVRQYVTHDRSQGNISVLFMQLLDGLKEQVGLDSGLVVQERDSEDVVSEGACVWNDADYEAEAHVRVTALCM